MSCYAVSYLSDVCSFKADAEHLVTKMKGGVQRGLVLRYFENIYCHLTFNDAHSHLQFTVGATIR